MRGKNSIKKKKKTTVILNTGRFGHVDSAVIISSVGRQCCASLLMMTTVSMLSKRPLFRITVAIFFFRKLTILSKFDYFSMNTDTNVLGLRVNYYHFLPSS